MDIRKINEQLLEFLESDSGFLTSKDLVEKNSSGPTYLVGGAVFRVISQLLHDVPLDLHDYDFATANIMHPIYLPEGWDIEVFRNKNHRFSNDEWQIDLFPLDSRFSPELDNGIYNIEGYFETVPYTPQAIALDLGAGKLLGAVGIDACINREFDINNHLAARIDAERKGLSFHDRAKAKAESMGFEYSPQVW